MFRGLLYGSYQKPKELVWIFGCTIYVAMMAEGFLGYVLPYGQMSYWGAQVIISLFGAIPYVGESLELWVRGDYYISGITVSRFFCTSRCCTSVGFNSLSIFTFSCIA